MLFLMANYKLGLVSEVTDEFLSSKVLGDERMEGA